MTENNVYIEFIPQGAYVKVTAIDSRTGIEATLVGDASAGRAMLEKLAIRKLRYVISKQKEE